MLVVKVYLLHLIVAVPAAAGRGRRGRRHSVEACSTATSDGPKDATIEVRIGNLPPSTAEQPLYLSWWAARKSATSYSPLTEPFKAEVYSSGKYAYADYGDLDFNGGRVRVSEGGEATVRVQTPATYKGHRGGNSVRDPHVHFSICGHHGRPKKIKFTSRGVEIQGGCRRRSSDTVSYTVLSVRDLNAGMEQGSNVAEVVAPQEVQTKLTETPEKEAQEKEAQAKITVTPDKEVQEKEAQAKMTETPEKDWDAIEFSPVYECLEGTELFDQFSSTCSSQCPAHADVAHGQCVRKKVTEAAKVTIGASWQLHLDCNDKCWADVVPTSRHMVRLAVADHLDITFQEASIVKLRRDSASPTTHAHLRVKVKTDRLDEGLGSSLMASFLPNASVVSDLLGLTVHAVEQVDTSDNQGPSPPGQISDRDATLPGETSDQYAEYYAPLEAQAEERAQTPGNPTSIAGVDVPEGVPMGAIIGGAVGAVVLFVVVGVWLRFRRKQLARNNLENGTMAKAGKEEEIVGKIEKTTENP